MTAAATRPANTLPEASPPAAAMLRLALCFLPLLVVTVTPPLVSTSTSS